MPPDHETALAPPEHAESGHEAERAGPYIARALLHHLVEDPEVHHWTGEGTAAFVDISGFTKLSEQLAKKGKEGAEQITDAIGDSFESILEVAYDSGGSLLKFGGDALLLWFQGDRHASRACGATVLMRRVLRESGRIEVPGAKVTLRMSQGVHSGSFNFFAVGSSHVELLPVGPAWTKVVTMEHVADAGEILISPETAAHLSSRCLGNLKGPGVLLRQSPDHAEKQPLVARPTVPTDVLLRCLPRAVRAHVVGGGGIPEHRPVTIAFIRFEGTDELIRVSGAAAVAEALGQLVSVVDAAAEANRVALLASDVDADGGKLILTAGAPTVSGDDEERMLLALRRIVETKLTLSIKIGVNRGSVFAGDIGPFYRRTYTVMGDAVNLSARVMAKAATGAVYATADVLERSNTLFETTEIEPFSAKGKTQLVRAWRVGRAKGSRTRSDLLQQLPVIGREAELAAIREALAAVKTGAGRLIEIVGEAGVGKTRLLEALHDETSGLHRQRAVCETYTASNPYAVWRELLREFMGFGRDDADELVEERLRSEVVTRAPDLIPWLPLIAIVFGLDVAPTPEVEMLAEKNRRAKLHEAVGRFLEVTMSDPQLIVIESVQNMDEASAELLAHLTGELANRPWLIGVARRPSEAGFLSPESPEKIRIQLGALTPQDAMRMTRVASEHHPLPMHVLEVVAKRSGGNPQFLRDLLVSATATGGIVGLPASAEAAAMARIDALAPDDRALVRRAAVFGLTFHPRMLAWFAEDDGSEAPSTAAWARMQEFFEEEGDGYLRFRRSLLRDTAYEGLPYKLRRRLHRAVATRLEVETDDPEESAGILSLHYFVAGEYRQAWRYASVAAKRADGVYAHVEAAGLYSRALEAGRRLEEVGDRELAATYEALGDSWNHAGDFRKAIEAYTVARRLAAADPLVKARLLLKRSRMEEKVGQYPQALRWAARARKAVDGLLGPDAARQVARSSAWYATMLQSEGRSNDAIRWAQRAIDEAEFVDDAEALGAAYFVIGWAYVDLGKEGVEQLWTRSLAAYERSGNLLRQASLLSNLGIACAMEGRWDEALIYLGRAREECLKTGNTVDAEVARLNTAEIITNRGEVAEAEELVLESLPAWRGLQYRYYLGHCLSLLGRTALGAGCVDDALSRFDEARSHYLHIGSQQDVLDVDARIAECHVVKGDPVAALESAGATLSRAGSSSGVAKVVPLLERVRGYALLQQRDFAAARRALQASLAAGRTRRDPLEVALTLVALIRLAGAEGVEPAPEIVNESRSLIASLKLRTVPAVPLAAR